MNKAEAEKALKPYLEVEDGEQVLGTLKAYVAVGGNAAVYLNGRFTPKELKAFIWWLDNGRR
jgi:hypothetical protein